MLADNSVEPEKKLYPNHATFRVIQVLVSNIARQSGFGVGGVAGGMDIV